MGKRRVDMLGGQDQAVHKGGGIYGPPTKNPAAWLGLCKRLARRGCQCIGVEPPMGGGTLYEWVGPAAVFYSPPRVSMDSSWTPHSPHGVPMESSWTPCGVLMDFVWTMVNFGEICLIECNS